MRFDDLLADLEAQLAATTDRELWDEAQGLMRGERARQGWGERLSARENWTLTLSGGQGLRGSVLRCGADWALLRTPHGEALVPYAAIRTAEPLSVRSAAGAAGAHVAPEARSTLRAALRLLSRHRPLVEAWLDTGGLAHGRLLHVGLDHAEFSDGAGLSVLIGLSGLSALVVMSEA